MYYICSRYVSLSSNYLLLFIFNILDFMYVRGLRVLFGRILYIIIRGFRYVEYNINDIKRYIC